MTVGAVALQQVSSKRRAESAGRRAVRRFFRHRAALAGLSILLVIFLSALFLPLLYNADPDATNTKILFQSPSSQHILGTDRIGRDLFARLLSAARVSLSVGIAAAFAATVIG